MIDFKKNCCICHKLGCKQEIDGHYLCHNHFVMVIGTMTFEGPDDEWHFDDEKDLELM